MKGTGIIFLGREKKRRDSYRLQKRLRDFFGYAKKGSGSFG